MQQMPAHIGFSEDHHHLVGVSAFPYDELFDRIDGTRSPTTPPLELAGAGLREILGWVWRSNTRRPNLRAAFRRFLAMSATMRPELFPGLGLRELGEAAGCTKALLSKQSIRFSEHFGGLQFRRQHNGRDNMRRAMKRSHQRRKHYENKSPNTTI